MGGFATTPEMDPQQVLLDQRIADDVAIDGGGLVRGQFGIDGELPGGRGLPRGARRRAPGRRSALLRRAAGGWPTTYRRSVLASLPDATTRWPTAGSKAPNKNSECGPR